MFIHDIECEVDNRGARLNIDLNFAIKFNYIDSTRSEKLATLVQKNTNKVHFKKDKVVIILYF